MDRRLPNELQELRITDFKDLPKALKLATQNIGKYQPVTLIEPGTQNELDSFYIRYYEDGTGKYLQLQEFKNESVYKVFKDELGGSAEELENVMGFRLKF